MDNQAHWQQVFADKNKEQMSWTESEVNSAFAALNKLPLNSDSSLLEAGCGVSELSVQALKAGFKHLTLVDISEQALALLKHKHQELKLDNSLSHYLNLDLGSQQTDVLLNQSAWLDCWIDRAVFHFMTSKLQQRQYINRVSQSLKPGGYWILATFSETGPEKCSNLPVQRYSNSQLIDYLEQVKPGHFQCIEHWQQTHMTPWQSSQSFNWWILKRC